MKLLITGHTSAVGKDITEVYNDYIGVSRITGFDLTNQADIQRVVKLSTEVDHVINLANVGKAQCDLLWEIYHSWQHIGKYDKIISFGTLATEVSYDLLQKIPVDMSMLGHKLALEKMHKELSVNVPFGKQPQSVLLRFANYGEKPGKRSNEPYTSSKQLIEVLDFIFKNDSYISTIDFREI